jgi:hypothetical protein
MAFEYSPSLYDRIPLDGRFIVTTTSSEIHWQTQGKDQIFPLLPGNSLDIDQITLIIEAKGFLLVSQDAETDWVQVGDFHRFEVQAINFTVSQDA